MHPGHRKFSLGAAAFDFPAADDCAHPIQHAPDSWRRALTTEHADAAVWSGIHTSCRAGQNLALQEAKHVRLRLDCTTGQAPDAWQRRLAAVQQALSLRNSSLPTSLTVIGDDTAVSAAAALAVPKALHAAGRSVTALELCCSAVSKHYQDFMRLAAAAFPNLSSVKLVNALAPLLAPPSHLPHLTQLSFTTTTTTFDQAHDHTDLCDMLEKSVALYTPQVTSLTALDGGYHDTWWPHIFTPQTRSHTLTHLTTNDYLTDELMSLIDEYAPAVKHVSVSNISFDEGAQDAVWGVEQLHIEDGVGNGHYVSATEVALLPKCAAGKMQIDMPTRELLLRLSDIEDLDVYQDLSQHIVKCKVFTVKVDIDLDDEIALLQRALRGIAKLPWEGVTVQLAEVDWTDAAAEAVTAALPTLTHLNLTTDIHKCTVLTDALLGLVLQLAPNMRSLHVWSLSLQSDQHANTPWPWEELTIDMLDIGQLGRLPMPAHDAMTTIRSQKIELLSVDEQADVTHLTGRLRRIHLLPVAAPPTVYVPWLSAGAARVQLSVLGSLRYHESVSRQVVQIVLQDWPLNHATELMRSLPEAYWAFHTIYVKAKGGNYRISHPAA